MKNAIRTAALNNAHVIRKYDSSLSWSVCMLLGWAKAKVVAAINAGAKVTYTTESGSTVERDAVSLSNYTSTTTKKTSPLAVVYFDKTADGIRSFRIDRLVKVA
jgi:hypothetical protein